MSNNNFCVVTQCYENYGTEDVPYWKAKWGSDFIVMNCPSTESAQKHVELHELLDNSLTCEQVLLVEEVEASYLTECERRQMVYDGAITSPSTRIDFAKVSQRPYETSHRCDDVIEMNDDYIS